MNVHEIYRSATRSKFAMTFNADEAAALIKVIPKEIAKLQKKIKAIEEHPENEGQCAFMADIRDIETQILDWQEMQSCFKIYMNKK
jgi:hypothetical protein